MTKKVQIDQEELPNNHKLKQNKYIGMQNSCQKIKKKKIIQNFHKVTQNYAKRNIEWLRKDATLTQSDHKEGQELQKYHKTTMEGCKITVKRCRMYI